VVGFEDRAWMGVGMGVGADISGSADTRRVAEALLVRRQKGTGYSGP
jgi:hypothetical protein